MRLLIAVICFLLTLPAYAQLNADTSIIKTSDCTALTCGASQANRICVDSDDLNIFQCDGVSTWVDSGTMGGQAALDIDGDGTDEIDWDGTNVLIINDPATALEVAGATAPTFCMQGIGETGPAYCFTTGEPSATQENWPVNGSSAVFRVIGNDCQGSPGACNSWVQINMESNTAEAQVGGLPEAAVWQFGHAENQTGKAPQLILKWRAETDADDTTDAWDLDTFETAVDNTHPAADHVFKIQPMWHSTFPGTGLQTQFSFVAWDTNSTELERTGFFYNPTQCTGTSGFAINRTGADTNVSAIAGGDICLSSIPSKDYAETVTGVWTFDNSTVNGNGALVVGGNGARITSAMGLQFSPGNTNGIIPDECGNDAADTWCDSDSDGAIDAGVFVYSTYSAAGPTQVYHYADTVALRAQIRDADSNPANRATIVFDPWVDDGDGSIDGLTTDPAELRFSDNVDLRLATNGRIIGGINPVMDGDWEFTGATNWTKATDWSTVSETGVTLKGLTIVQNRLVTLRGQGVITHTCTIGDGSLGLTAQATQNEALCDLDGDNDDTDGGVAGLSFTVDGTPSKEAYTAHSAFVLELGASYLDYYGSGLYDTTFSGSFRIEGWDATFGDNDADGYTSTGDTGFIWNQMGPLFMDMADRTGRIAFRDAQIWAHTCGGVSAFVIDLDDDGVKDTNGNDALIISVGGDVGFDDDCDGTIDSNDPVVEGIYVDLANIGGSTVDGTFLLGEDGYDRLVMAEGITIRDMACYWHEGGAMPSAGDGTFTLYKGTAYSGTADPDLDNDGTVVMTVVLNETSEYVVDFGTCSSGCDVAARSWIGIQHTDAPTGWTGGTAADATCVISYSTTLD